MHIKQLNKIGRADKLITPQPNIAFQLFEVFFYSKSNQKINIFYPFLTQTLHKFNKKAGFQKENRLDN